MRTVTQHAKSNFLFKSFDLKSLSIVLVTISSVSTDKWVVCGIESVFASFVGEIESFKVFYKDVFCNVFDSCNITALIDRLSGEIVLCCCVSHDLLPASSIFCSDGLIVVTLYPEMKITSSCYHFIVGLLVVIELFKVCYIAPNLTATNWYYQVY